MQEALTEQYDAGELPVTAPSKDSASILQSSESFSYHAPEWKDHTGLKEALTANEHAFGEAITGAFERQADVYVCLAKACAILSQREDKDEYVMREKAKIINPVAGKRWTWSAYFASFRAQYNFNKCLRTVQMKLAEMAGGEAYEETSST
jgi:hypothetical protein